MYSIIDRGSFLRWICGHGKTEVLVMAFNRGYEDQDICCVFASLVVYGTSVDRYQHKISGFLSC